MTWNTGRKDWMGRGRQRAIPTSSSQPVDPHTPVVLPLIPAFSPACIAFVLSTTRQLVYYWMTKGRLTFYRDPLGDPYVLREELIVFIEHYLHRPITLRP